MDTRLSYAQNELQLNVIVRRQLLILTSVVYNMLMMNEVLVAFIKIEHLNANISRVNCTIINKDPEIGFILNRL